MKCVSHCLLSVINHPVRDPSLCSGLTFRTGLPNTARKDKIKHEGAEEAGRFGVPLFFLFSGFPRCRKQHCSCPASKDYIAKSGALIGGNKESRPPG